MRKQFRASLTINFHLRRSHETSTLENSETERDDSHTKRRKIVGTIFTHQMKMVAEDQLFVHVSANNKLETAKKKMENKTENTAAAHTY